MLEIRIMFAEKKGTPDFGDEGVDDCGLAISCCEYR